MDQEMIDLILSDFKNKVVENTISYYKIIIFGSASDNSYHSESDIDIAIISDDFVNKSISERAMMMSDIEFELIGKYLIPLDIIKLTIDEYENETRMIASYVKEGKVLYSASTFTLVLPISKHSLPTSISIFLNYACKLKVCFLIYKHDKKNITK